MRFLTLLGQIFIGQIMGTSVGTTLFNAHGWRAAAAMSFAWQSFAVLVLLTRGPRCSRYTWLGYEGGTDWRKPRVHKNTEQPAVTSDSAPTGEEDNGEIEEKQRSTPLDEATGEKAEIQSVRSSTEKPAADTKVEQA